MGEAIGEILKDSKEREQLKDMYANWGSFRTTIDLVEMVLAKSEPEISEMYEKLLVEDEGALDLGAEIRKTHMLTEQAILDLTSHCTLGENNKFLLQGLSLRNPYVDCLNVLQAEILRRLRLKHDISCSEEEKILHDALMISINGIANGMKNTG